MPFVVKEGSAELIAFRLICVWFLMGLLCTGVKAEPPANNKNGWQALCMGTALAGEGDMYHVPKRLQRRWELE
jgi:hypothetical protein